MASERDRVSTAVKAHEKLGMKVEVTVDEALEVLTKTNGICRYCGRTMVRGKGKMHNLSPSLDRINNEMVLTKDNIQFICKECNTTKGDRPHSDFIAYLKQIVANNPRNKF
jgi:5-methylcytosine-specific restriction endonuclease McrA